MVNFLLVLINSGVVQRNIGYLALVLYEIFFLQIMTKGKIVINSIAKSPVWLLAVSGLIYGLARDILGSRLLPSLVIYCLLPVLIFIAGYTIADRKDEKNNQSIEKCLCAIAIGCAIHVILNIFTNINITYRMESADFFTGQLAATNLGSLNTYIFGLFPCLVITKRKGIKIMGTVVFLLSVIYGFILGTRSSIYGLIIMIIISVFLYVRKHYSKRIRFNVLAKWCGVGIIIIGIIMLIYYTDLLSIRTNIESSMLISRYHSKYTAESDLTRFNRFIEGIAYLFEHPFGGNQVNAGYYFHNYWLDVGRVAGVIPVILIISLDIILFRHMFTIFRNDSISEDLRYALFGIYICTFINFFVEPIMDGYLDLFYRFTLINGMVEGLYDTLCRQNIITMKIYSPNSALD